MVLRSVTQSADQRFQRGDVLVAVLTSTGICSVCDHSVTKPECHISVHRDNRSRRPRLREHQDRPASPRAERWRASVAQPHDTAHQDRPPRARRPRGCWIGVDSASAYSSPPARTGGLVRCSERRVRRAPDQIRDPQLLIITPTPES